MGNLARSCVKIKEMDGVAHLPSMGETLASNPRDEKDREQGQCDPVCTLTGEENAK